MNKIQCMLLMLCMMISGFSHASQVGANTDRKKRTPQQQQQKKPAPKKQTQTAPITNVDNSAFCGDTKPVKTNNDKPIPNTNEQEKITNTDESREKEDDGNTSPMVKDYDTMDREALRENYTIIPPTNSEVQKEEINTNTETTQSPETETVENQDAQTIDIENQEIIEEFVVVSDKNDVQENNANSDEREEINLEQFEMIPADDNAPVSNQEDTSAVTEANQLEQPEQTDGANSDEHVQNENSSQEPQEKDELADQNKDQVNLVNFFIELCKKYPFIFSTWDKQTIENPPLNTKTLGSGYSFYFDEVKKLQDILAEIKGGRLNELDFKNNGSILRITVRVFNKLIHEHRFAEILPLLGDLCYNHYGKYHLTKQVNQKDLVRFLIDNNFDDDTTKDINIGNSLKIVTGKLLKNVTYNFLDHLEKNEEVVRNMSSYLALAPKKPEDTVENEVLYTMNELCSSADPLHHVYQGRFDERGPLNMLSAQYMTKQDLINTALGNASIDPEINDNEEVYYHFNIDNIQKRCLIEEEIRKLTAQYLALECVTITNQPNKELAHLRDLTSVSSLFDTQQQQ